MAYKVLSDGQPYDLTLQVSGNEFTAGTERYTRGMNSPIKHKLISQTVHTALTDTNTDRTTLGVGEEVLLYFDPELDPVLELGLFKYPLWIPFEGSVSPSIGSITMFTAPSNAVTALVRVLVRDAFVDKYGSSMLVMGLLRRL
jgi:hypothetical protein